MPCIQSCGQRMLNVSLQSLVHYGKQLCDTERAMNTESNFVFATEQPLVPPGKPPDMGGSPVPTPNTTTEDKVMGNVQAPLVREKLDLIAQNLVRVEHE